MSQEYYQKWGELYEKAHKPMQALAELNLKTWQDLKNNNFEDYFKAKKPEDVFELQFKLFMDQSQKTLDYWQKSLDILQQSAKEFGKSTHPSK